MQGLKDLTKGIRAIALKEREEAKVGLLETEEEAKARIEKEKKEKEKEEQTPAAESILKPSASQKKVAPGKKKVAFQPEYDSRGTELGPHNPIVKKR